MKTKAAVLNRASRSVTKITDLIFVTARRLRTLPRRRWVARTRIGAEYVRRYGNAPPPALGARAAKPFFFRRNAESYTGFLRELTGDLFDHDVERRSVSS